MANELAHGTVGVSMTQAEFEAVGLHVLNAQAIGDVIYASSTTQLRRLGIGATNAILTVIGGIPTWQTSLSGLTFVAPALGAATATSINGLVITTTAGTLTIANNASAALITSGNYSITLTATAATSVTLPTTGTLATLAGTEELDSKTLDSSVGKGTWTASGTWTLPAFTLGGNIAGANQEINLIHYISLNDTAGAIAGQLYGTAGKNVYLRAGAYAVGSGGLILLALNTTVPELTVATSDAARTADRTRLSITGATDAGAVATWADVTHTGLKITSAGNIDCAGTGANGWIIKNPKNSAASALSGTQLDVTIDIGGTPYYFTVYPSKA